MYVCAFQELLELKAQLHSAVHSAKDLLLLRSYAQGRIYWKYSGEQQRERHLR